ncbi:uncharacterized protein LOC135469048 isoform X1 [Liolophura sinensis]|uniref:uncharacterized protein LOC135469048 isoform X1 n=1 Tax=Liolophura sinensis TaxID=3198878 RepID=UPI00315945E7
MASISSDEIRASVRKILKGADLTSLSSKKVRRMLEEQYDADFTDRKQEIDDILMKAISEEEDSQNSQASNGKNSESEASSESEDEIEVEPPKKKAKPSTKSKGKKSSKPITPHNTSADLSDDEADVDDEELAKQLQEEESGGRKSRHRSVKKSPVQKKKKRKEKTPRKTGTSTYSQPCVLSPDLATIMGTDRMARKDVVKRMWEIVKERKLEDPKNRQFMVCDEELFKVFGKKRIRTFGMMKFLKSHIKDMKDIVE